MINTGILDRGKRGIQNAAKNGVKKPGKFMLWYFESDYLQYTGFFSEWPGYKIIFKSISYTWDDIFIVINWVTSRCWAFEAKSLKSVMCLTV